MKTLLFFDSNQITACSLKKECINQLAQNGVDCFTSMYVIDELASQRTRKLISNRNEVYQFAKNINYKRFNISFQDITDNDIKKEYQEERKRLKELFEPNILKYMNTPEQNFETIRKRNMFKTPPFVDGNGNSDKGWNDTLIWLDFCEYCKNSSYDKYYFVTADNCFHNATLKQKLEAEFESLTQKQDSIVIKQFKSCNEIFSLFKCDSKVQNNTTLKLSIINDNNINNISPEIIERCRTSIENLFYTINRNDYDQEWNVPNVKIFCTVDQDSTYRFYGLLEEKIDEYIIYDEIDLKTIFDEMGIECESTFTTKKQYYDDFVQCMQETKENKRLFKSCMSFLMTTINKMYVKKYYI